MKTLVVSAVNLNEAGPLTVLRDCVAAARQTLPDWRIVVIAHDSGLIDTEGVEVIAEPRPKTRWLRRLKFEWFDCRPLSAALDADLWLALHDITPRVVARRQAVYCHNPTPFAKPIWRDFWFEPKFLLFSLFYGYLYRCFIHRNHTVIVQQSWLRDEFRRLWGVGHVIVAYPQRPGIAETTEPRRPAPASAATQMLYPALPRCSKNFELIGSAVEILEQAGGWTGTVRWTIDGTENRYARWLHRRYGHLRSIEWIGRRNRLEMADEYQRADVLVFPSRLETWGLPITEAKDAGLALLVADLPYAHETVGTWHAARFFDPSSAHDLAQAMREAADTDRPFPGAQAPVPAEPFAPTWPALIRQLTDGL